MLQHAGFYGFCIEVPRRRVCKLLIDKWLSFGPRRGSHKTGAKLGSIARGCREDGLRLLPSGGIVASNTRGVYVRFGSRTLKLFVGRGVVYCGHKHTASVGQNPQLFWTHVGRRTARLLSCCLWYDASGGEVGRMVRNSDIESTLIKW